MDARRQLDPTWSAHRNATVQPPGALFPPRLPPRALSADPDLERRGRDALHGDLPVEKALQELDVGRCVSRDGGRAEGARTRERERQDDLIGEVLSDRRIACEVAPAFRDGVHGDLLRRAANLPETAEDLGDVLGLDLDRD